MIMQIDLAYREIAPKLQSYLTGNGSSYATACDIVQETFLRLWERREDLSDDLRQVSGLAFTIARNYRNDLARKARHEALGGESSVDGDEGETGGLSNGARPGEEAEETAVLKQRLRGTLGRMPVQLLEAFALSRLGKLSVKDIASGTGMSVANVKVRVHRAKELFAACFRNGSDVQGGEPGSAGGESAVMKALMMLAAVDGEISAEELSLYRKLAENFRGKGALAFEALWKNSIRSMAYIGFLSEMLTPEELVCEYVQEVRGAFVAEGRQIDGRILVALEKMAASDGDYSRIERDCIRALSERCRTSPLGSKG